MSEKYWVFCKNCGKSYQTRDLKVQFCSKKCMDLWENHKNDEHLGQAKNFGQVDKSRYKKWRHSVYNKFDRKCAICGTEDKKLHAHHVVRWADSVELRYEIDNSLLVCEDCHSMIHGYSIGTGTKILKNKERIKKIRKKYIKIANILYRKK